MRRWGTDGAENAQLELGDLLGDEELNKILVALLQWIIKHTIDNREELAKCGEK